MRIQPVLVWLDCSCVWDTCRGGGCGHLTGRCHMWLFGGRRRPGPVRGGMWPPALLGSGASGVSVPLVRGSDCPPVLGFCPGDSLTSSLEG